MGVAQIRIGEADGTSGSLDAIFHYHAAGGGGGGGNCDAIVGASKFYSRCGPTKCAVAETYGVGKAVC